MAVTLFFGIRLSGRPYERIAHKLDEDVYSTYKVESLKKLLVGDLLKNRSDASGLELVYCGSVLDDWVELSKEGIKSGSTIHVFEKNDKQETDQAALTEDAIFDASKAYRNVCNSGTSTLNLNSETIPFPKVIRPEVLNKVLEKYPEFYSDPGAFAILNDPVLLEKMFRSNQAKQIGEQYPLLVNSAKFVAETLRSYIKKNPQNLLQSSAEDTSDSSASENDSPHSSPNQSDNQRSNISRNQLAAALLFAGTASLNSQSNIADRSTDDEEMATTSNITSSSGASSHSATADPGTSGNSQRYAAELQTMQEMGLTEESSNLQALILCNGNVEAAVTLVLGLGNFA